MRWLILTALIAMAGAQDLPDGFDPTVFMDSLYAEVSAACPNGVERCECLNAPGTFTEGPFDPREEVIGSLLTYAGCGPGYCFCKDAPEKEIDVRNQLFYDVLDLCEKNDIDRCLCEDGKSKINGPIDLVGLFSCRPKKCKCKGSKEVKVNTGTGCAKGGFPDCPTPGELYCKDGLKLDPSATMRFRTKTAVERRQFGKGWKGCACSDGVMPRCKETGEPLKCPSGDFPDYDKYHGMEELAACRIEQW